MTDPKLRYQSRPWRATWFVVALLVLTSAWLGYAAQDAARDHRAAVEATYLDYTGMAARELARLSGESVHWLQDELFDRGRGRRSRFRRIGTYADEINEQLDWHDCACPTMRELLLEFRINETARSIEIVPEGALEPDAELWLVDRVAGRGEEDLGVLPIDDESPFSQPVAVWYGVRSQSGDGTVVDGFVVPAPGIGELVEHWYQNNPLLPPSSRRGSLPNDSLLHARVLTPGGALLFSSSEEELANTVSHDTVAAEFGGLTVAVDVRPMGAQAFAAGGLPPSRTPLFLGMLALVVALGVGGVVQYRREVELARLRDDFVSGASHELRTPLAQIRLFAHLQRSGKLRTEEQRQRAVDVIDREAKRLAHLLENVLHFNEPARGLSARRSVVVRDIVDEVADGLGLLFEAKNSSLRTEIESDLRVSTAGDSLERVLGNLLDNALKYGPRGQTVVVTGAATPRGILIGVEDEGPGVPTSDRELIWQRYRRLDRDIRGPESGTGVGLAVVAELAREHDGEVWVEDAPGGGARFVVCLPPAEGSERIELTA